MADVRRRRHTASFVASARRIADNSFLFLTFSRVCDKIKLQQRRIKMKDKKDIFNGKILDSEVGKIKFTLVFIPTLLLVLGATTLLISIFYDKIEPSARVLSYVISISCIVFSLIYAFATIPLIRCYPKYRKITHFFIREEFFKANYDERRLEIISLISKSIEKNKK